MPVMGSSLALNCASVHDGEIRRSAEAFGETMRRETSRAAWRDMVAICSAMTKLV